MDGRQIGLVLLVVLALLAASCDDSGFGRTDEAPGDEVSAGSVGEVQPDSAGLPGASGTSPVELRYIGVEDIEQVWLYETDSSLTLDERKRTLLTSDLIPGDSLIGSGSSNTFRSEARDLSVHLELSRGTLYVFEYVQMPDAQPQSAEVERDVWSDIGGELAYSPGLRRTPAFEVGVNFLGEDWELVKETAIIHGSPPPSSTVRPQRSGISVQRSAVSGVGGAGAGVSTRFDVLYQAGGYEVREDRDPRFRLEQVYQDQDGLLYLFQPPVRALLDFSRIAQLLEDEDLKALDLKALLHAYEDDPFLKAQSPGPQDVNSDGLELCEELDAADETQDCAVGLQGEGPFPLLGWESAARDSWPDSESVKYDYVDFGRKPPRSDCPLENPDLVIHDQNPEIPDIVERWAPALYQEVDPDNHEADLITRVDYDGNMVGRDNATNRSAHPLPAVVYYSVVRGSRHDFIGYYFYYVQDTEAGHDHDMEGVLLAYNRCTSHLDNIMTTQPGGLEWYVAPDAEPAPPAERLFTLQEWDSAAPSADLYQALALGIEAGSHTVWGRWDSICVIGPSGQARSGCDDADGGEGVVYFYNNLSLAPPPPFPSWPAWDVFPYSLIDLQGLWDFAHQETSCGDTELFACERPPPWDAFFSDSADTASLPWSWGPSGVRDHACTTTVKDMYNPNLFLDPAALFWPGPYFVHGYLDHPYAATSNCR